MFSVTNLLYSFFNKMSNGIYPEQSIYVYNKEKREELYIIKEEQKIKDIIDKEVKNLKIKKIINIQNNLKIHTTIITNLNNNEINLTILRRIYYILFNLLNNFSLYDTNYNKKLFNLDKFVNSLVYTSPFDNEDIIIDRLLLLTDYLNNYFSNNPEIKKSVSCHVAALPVPFRTNEQYPTFMYIKDEGCDCIDGNVSHIALDGLTCTRFEMGNFAKDCAEMNVNFIGICCGADPHHVREMSVSLGRKPISYKYYPDMNKHFAYGNDKKLKELNKAQHLKS